MPRNHTDIFDAALALSEHERATLADRLLESLHRPINPAVEAAWADEVQRRLADLDAGRAETLPWPHVREKLRRLARGQSE